MYAHFPLFQSHLDLAQHYWQRLLKPGSLVIDATCGNGRDSLHLAKLALTDHAGELYCLDVQQAALEATEKLLRSHLAPDQYSSVRLQRCCHSRFPEKIREKSVSLIVYNLGYLPQSDKQITTQWSTTHESLVRALDLIKAGGAISITAYPGHEAGKREEDELTEYVRTLDPQQWSCCHHQWLNRKSSPSLFLLQRRT